VIQHFADRGTEDIYHGKNSSQARRCCPQSLWDVAYRKLDQLDSAARLTDLAAPPGNRLERLRGDRVGQYSIRINEQYRICFRWTEAGPDAVEIVDYHR
jgi:proteic killer suppression protein